jgi:hypothetical protein
MLLVHLLALSGLELLQAYGTVDRFITASSMAGQLLTAIHCPKEVGSALQSFLVGGSRSYGQLLSGIASILIPIQPNSPSLGALLTGSNQLCA